MTEYFNPILSPWPWIVAGLALPAIVALYFLKLRRKPVEVPSTYLWSRTIEDLHVNSLWQRLRQSLLLFLQLLVILLALFAFLRPGVMGTKLLNSRVIILLDQSASMSAKDVSPSRLDEAKKRALEIVDKLGPSDVAMVIAYSDEAQVVQEYTDNRSLLRQKIQAIEPRRVWLTPVVRAKTRPTYRPRTRSLPNSSSSATAASRRFLTSLSGTSTRSFCRSGPTPPATSASSPSPPNGTWRSRSSSRCTAASAIIR